MEKNNLIADKIRRLYWDKNLNVAEVAKKLDTSFWTLYDFMERNDIPRRVPSEATYVSNKEKPQFKIKQNLGISEQKLKIAGVMLYWAEGTLKGCTVDFANSNPEIIKVFLKFLRNICGVNEQRLRVYLYTHSNRSILKLKKYWHGITKIPLNQFTKPYIRKAASNPNSRKMLYGLIHIRYNDKRLLKKIESWIDEYTNR